MVRCGGPGCEAPATRSGRLGHDTPQWELEAKWEHVEATLKDVRFFGDLAVRGVLPGDEGQDAGGAAASAPGRRARVGGAGGGCGADEHRDRLAVKRKGSPAFAPFHWEIEFPEVFGRENPGFDAFVGNPPFGGHVNIVSGNVSQLHRLASQSARRYRGQV